jgi:hypothetical protein
MDREIKKLPPGDVTKPWKRQFFETRSIGPEPPINAEGFWTRPKHGIPVKRKKNHDRTDRSSK